MTPVVRRCVYLVAVAVCVSPFASPLRAASIPTHCIEREVPLDAIHSVARLGRCGDDVSGEPLWYLDRIDQVSLPLDGRFDRRSSGAGSVIYVMDTGVMAAHSEFATPTGSRVVAGFDESSMALGRSRCARANKALDPCYTDYQELESSSHGTAIASIAAGRNIGVAPEATVVSIRVMNEHGLATTRNYLDGLNAIIRHAWDARSPSFHTAVVNISGWVLERLGADGPDSPVVSYSTVERKIEDMIHGVDAEGRVDPNGKRFLFVVAANNTDTGCGASGIIDRFPATLGARIDGLITVGGMTSANRNWSGTCRGGVEVLAPAEGIIGATITGRDDYRSRQAGMRSGTSFAAPIISGIAACLLSETPDLTPETLEAVITATPSRVDDANADLAGGKVAFVQPSTPPPAVVATTAGSVGSARVAMKR